MRVLRIARREAHLKIAIASRDVIGQTNGLLMATLNCCADDAFAILKEQSQRLNIGLREIAEGVVMRHEQVARV